MTAVSNQKAPSTDPRAHQLVPPPQMDRFRVVLQNDALQGLTPQFQNTIQNILRNEVPNQFKWEAIAAAFGAAARDIQVQGREQLQLEGRVEQVEQAFEEVEQMDVEVQAIIDIFENEFVDLKTKTEFLRRTLKAQIAELNLAKGRTDRLGARMQVLGEVSLHTLQNSLNSLLRKKEALEAIMLGIKDREPHLLAASISVPIVGGVTSIGGGASTLIGFGALALDGYRVALENALYLFPTAMPISIATTAVGGALTLAGLGVIIAKVIEDKRYKVLSEELELIQEDIRLSREEHTNLTRIMLAVV